MVADVEFAGAERLVEVDCRPAQPFRLTAVHDSRKERILNAEEPFA